MRAKALLFVAVVGSWFASSAHADLWSLYEKFVGTYKGLDWTIEIKPQGVAMMKFADGTIAQTTYKPFGRTARDEPLIVLDMGHTSFGLALTDEGMEVRRRDDNTQMPIGKDGTTHFAEYKRVDAAPMATLTLTQKDCHESPDCEKSGLCLLRNNECVASKAGCQASINCKEHGACLLFNNECGVAAEADCKRSRGCKTEGKCILLDHNCATAADSIELSLKRIDSQMAGYLAATEFSKHSACYRKMWNPAAYARDRRELCEVWLDALTGFPVKERKRTRDQFIEDFCERWTFSTGSFQSALTNERCGIALKVPKEDCVRDVRAMCAW